MTGLTSGCPGSSTCSLHPFEWKYHVEYFGERKTLEKRAHNDGCTTVLHGWNLQAEKRKYMKATGQTMRVLETTGRSSIHAKSVHGERARKNRLKGQSLRVTPRVGVKESRDLSFRFTAERQTLETAAVLV